MKTVRGGGGGITPLIHGPVKQREKEEEEEAGRVEEAGATPTPLSDVTTSPALEPTSDVKTSTEVSVDDVAVELSEAVG